MVFRTSAAFSLMAFSCRRGLTARQMIQRVIVSKNDLDELQSRAEEAAFELIGDPRSCVWRSAPSGPRSVQSTADRVSSHCAAGGDAVVVVEGGRGWPGKEIRKRTVRVVDSVIDGPLAACEACVDTSLVRCLRLFVFQSNEPSGSGVRIGTTVGCPGASPMSV